MNVMAEELSERSLEHDASKLEEKELPHFAKYTSKLEGMKFDSAEYQFYRDKLKPALDHHYAKNRHHPQHFKSGIQGMTLMDLMEMMCDWLASTKRNKDGNIYVSLERCQKDFKYSDELKQIFRNTVDSLQRQIKGKIKMKKELTRKKMEQKYGTPEAFKKSCMRAVPGDISIDEAINAIEKYQKEWDEAK